jgi:uncharacterized protein (TIGR02679 family)
VVVTHDERLTRLLGGGDLAWLVDRVRRRLERDQTLDTTVTLAAPEPAQRAAVQRLLGRVPRAGTSLSVSLPAVDHVLRASGACPDGLSAAVVRLSGPVVSRPAAAAEAERRWQEAFALVERVVASCPALADWFAAAIRTGLVRRLARTPDDAAVLLGDLATVLRELPAGGEAIGSFAARLRLTGGAHALDDDRPLATLVLGAARALTGGADAESRRDGAEARREVWAAVGLLRDELSSTVLTLGLPGEPDKPTGRALASLREGGQPVVLTLRQLVRDAPRQRVKRVFVCENPTVVSAAADRLAGKTAPLVCTSGQPGAAVLNLLRRLVADGAELRYHGDFDWGGLRIGNVVFDRLPMQPWRYTREHYQQFADRGRALTGVPVQAAWDDSLTSAMVTAGRAVEEELMLDDLLSDLT